MFSTAGIRFTSNVAAMALLAALLFATVTAGAAAPAHSKVPGTVQLAPLSADAGIRLGAVTPDGDCVVVKRVSGSASKTATSEKLSCIQ